MLLEKSRRSTPRRKSACVRIHRVRAKASAAFAWSHGIESVLGQGWGTSGRSRKSRHERMKPVFATAGQF